ncbi:MAG TPA: glycosyltransferase [Chitinophagales bacterium]|nr:glycosyltransferase [Chitinophagales bacterium]
MSGRCKRILVAPLDWGLGHATRCIPVINEILSYGHEPVLAADGRAFDLLKGEYPQLKIIRLKGYHPRYPAQGNMAAAMFFQLPKFFFAIAREHIELKKIIREYSIDAIISDNRYGLWSDSIPSVFITHQLFIRMPERMKWLEKVVNGLNHYFIRQFRHCWVPDFAGEENLSGELSHRSRMPLKVEYIGLLCRKSQAGNAIGNRCKYDLLALLSGPEPQRTLFEEEMKRQLLQLKLRALIVRGVTEENKTEKVNDFIEAVSHLSAHRLFEAMESSEVVVCRAGYSSLMELITLQKKAVIIPTPGQTEQEYLARRCRMLNYFASQLQHEMNLKSALQAVKRTHPVMAASPSSNFFVIKRWIDSI